MPDILFAIATGLLVMAVVFFIASFVDDNLSDGTAGTQIARIFAGTLTLSAIFIFLLGMLLMRDRNRLDYFIIPLAVGAVVGALESALFLNPKSPFYLLIPLLLLFFVLRPVRRSFAGLVQGRARARG